MADIEENARRKATGKKEIPLSPIAIEVVRRIDALFEIERGRFTLFQSLRCAPRALWDDKLRRLISFREANIVQKPAFQKPPFA